MHEGIITKSGIKSVGTKDDKGGFGVNICTKVSALGWG